MCCNICGSVENGLNIFKLNICERCFEEITNITVIDKNYEDYKNLIRIVLSYYIDPMTSVNNLAFQN